jgi:ABC-type branched-subunit amino acid transport system substrate-binding protein
MRVLSDAGSIRLGGVGPLTPPGIASAGSELLAGMEIAIEQANANGGVAGRPLELLFEDTRGLPAAAVEALERLRAAGACALVGEFHSVVTEILAEQADRTGIPFLASSATLDAITARRSPYVFRLAPPQSYGWTVYADFLLARGFRHVIEIIREDVYWNGGAAVLRQRLEPAGVRVSRVAVAADEPAPVIAERIEAHTFLPVPAIALLLVGYPEPLGEIVGELARRHLIDGGLELGDPAGRAIFPEWWDTVGAHGAGVPYLSYELPGRLTPTGRHVARAFRERHGREPSFVALEGYDTIAVLARALQRAPNLDAESICAALRTVEAPATRGVVRFTVEPDGVVHQQWTWPPVCVATRGTSGAPLSDAHIVWTTPETGS